MAWFFIRRYVDRAEFTATTCSHVVNRPRWFQDVVVKAITPGLKGQLKQVRHLVEVTPVEEGK